jgi:hypothetical protein
MLHFFNACFLGEGIGATFSEAKELAAMACLIDMHQFLDDPELLAFKPIVRTDPYKDILYLLRGICSEYGMLKPVYRKNEAHGSAEELVYNCVVGPYVTQGKKIKNISTFVSIDYRRRDNSYLLSIMYYLLVCLKEAILCYLVIPAHSH